MKTVIHVKRRPPRDRVFWLAARAVYAAGISAERTAALLGIASSTLLARASKEGWLRRDLAREAEAALDASIAHAVPGSEDALKLARTPAAEGGTSDPDSIAPKALAAADAALTRAIEAAARADAAGAEAATKLGEKLARIANVLGRTKRPRSVAERLDDPEVRRNALLAQIDRALEGGREARRLEVEAMRERGMDPREAWVWDAAERDWLWDPGSAMARASQGLAPRPSDAIDGEEGSEATRQE